MITDFIWGKRKAKIKKEVIIQNIENGGLKVPSFIDMIKANKLSWVKRIIDPAAKWNKIFEDLVSPISIFYFTTTSLDNEVIQSIPITFYQQIYNVWNDFKPESNTPQEYVTENIWYNKYIKIASDNDRKRKHSFLWQSYYAAGLQKVKDLFRNDRTLISFDEFIRKYGGKCNFLQFQRLKKAIPKHWLDAISNSSVVNFTDTETVCYCKIQNKMIDVRIVNTKMFYDMLIKMKYVKPTAIYRWNGLFEIHDTDWESILKLPYTATRETKLQSFQFKVIHRIIACKKWLYMQNILETDKCETCNIEDNLIHFFVECRLVTTFWKMLENWWNRLAKNKVKITTKHIIFGFYYDKSYFCNINYVIILAKWYIYRQKLKDGSICFMNFIVELKNKLCIEEYICTKQGKHPQFVKKNGKTFTKTCK